jgi:hypothetical protein
MTTKGKGCICGCGSVTNTTPSGVRRDFIRGHNRRLVGSNGWLEGGYRYIYVKGRKIAEHRHVMEQQFGRKLTSNEVVHHVDGNPLNNEPANLVVLTRSEHQRLHACSSRKPWKAGQSTRALALRDAGMTIWVISVVLGTPFSTTAKRLARLMKESACWLRLSPTVGRQPRRV